MQTTNIPTIDLNKPKDVIKGSYQVVTPNPPPDPVGGRWGTSTESKSLPYGELLKTMYFIWDGLTNFGIRFFPVRETGRQMIKGLELQGDHLDIGIRKLEWTSDNKFLIEQYFANDHVEKISETDSEAKYELDGIPFTIHIYEDNPCIDYLSSIQYEVESWYVPQRFDEFCEKYDK